jgi:ABC-2 type transport system permease protein
MVSTDQEAQQAAFPVMLPLIFSAVLIQMVIQNPEAGLARFGAWFPLTAPIVMPMRMAMVSTSALEVAAVLAGLAVTCVVVLWASARVYRVGLLMYGKRPSLAELGRWVRQAG